MYNLPSSKRQFVKDLCEMLKHSMPGADIVIHDNQSIYIDSRRLDVDDIYRLAKIYQKDNADVEAYLMTHINKYVASLKIINDDEASDDFESLRNKILPRIHPTTILHHVDATNVPYVSYVNDTIITFVRDSAEMMVSITKAFLDKWKLTVDDLEEVAKNNLTKISEDVESQVVEAASGGVCIFFNKFDGYDASRLLLPDLYANFYKHLKGNFYVAIPNRDVFIAMSCKPDDFVKRIKTKIAKDYKEIAYPITPKLFYVTMDGVCET